MDADSVPGAGFVVSFRHGEGRWGCAICKRDFQLAELDWSRKETGMRRPVRFLSSPRTEGLMLERSLEVMASVCSGVSARLEQENRLGDHGSRGPSGSSGLLACWCE